ncbi:MAG: hypothetical protein KDC43_12620, partial [Saprospiraceae bacterium]|nr:hypothetical protein [Saprospiraceae bacterium]
RYHYRYDRYDRRSGQRRRGIELFSSFLLRRGLSDRKVPFARLWQSNLVRQVLFVDLKALPCKC